MITKYDSRAFWPLVILLFGVLAYHNSLSGQFVYDDLPIIVENPLIRDLRQIPILFGTGYWGFANHHPQIHPGSLYRPFTLLTYALNYHLSGLAPWSYHFINIALHLGVSVLLFFLFEQLGATRRAAGLGALFYAVLPIHVEAVASIVGRAELLAALFLIASWLMIQNKTGLSRISLGLIFFLGALLSKENAACFPFVLILSDIATHTESIPSLFRKRGLLWTAYLGLLLLYLEWRYVMMGSCFGTGGELYFRATSLFTVWLTMSKFIVFHYVWPAFSGFGLSADFSRPQILDSSLSDVHAWICLVGLGCLATGSLYYALVRKNKKAYPILLFFLFLFPVSNIVLRIDIIGAERLLYLPTIGLCLWGGLVVSEWLSKEFAIAVVSGVAVLLAIGGWTAQTIRRNRIWHDEQTFWTDTVYRSSHSAQALNGFGVLCLNEGHAPLARTYFVQALALEPGFTDAAYNLGRSYFLEGQLENAKPYFLRVMVGDPYDEKSLVFLGLIEERQKHWNAAGGYYERTLSINPYNTDAWLDLGMLQFKTGHRPEGRLSLRNYIDLSPDTQTRKDVIQFIVRNGAN